MDSSKKRPRAEDKQEKEILPCPTRQRLNDEQSDVTTSNPPHQNEERYTLPEPPVRAVRKPVSSQKSRGDKIANLVKDNILPNEYEHKALSGNPEDDQIRLLILHPRNLGHTIICHFQVYRLSDATQGKYEALSYCWGTELADCEINILSEQNHSQPEQPRNRWKLRLQRFYIRPNLHAALTHLQSKEQDIALWVDALCIN